MPYTISLKHHPPPMILKSFPIAYHLGLTSKLYTKIKYFIFKLWAHFQRRHISIRYGYICISLCLFGYQNKHPFGTFWRWFLWEIRRGGKLIKVSGALGITFYIFFKTNLNELETQQSKQLHAFIRNLQEQRWNSYAPVVIIRYL
jgi:hypothetical protein